MAKLLKLRRGTTTQHASFTGAEGELTVDITKDTAVVHDGSQAGGRPLAREDMSNVSSASIAGRLGTDSIATSKIAGGTLPSDVTVASANLVDGTIVNADVNTSAAIAGTKIAPNFGSQAVTTTGNITSSAGDISTTNGTIAANKGTNNQVLIGHDGAIEISRNNGGGFIDFRSNTSEDHDARIQENNGGFTLTGNVDIASGLDVTGDSNIDGKLTITQSGATTPEIELDGNGPNFIRFNDDSGGTAGMDLVFRSSPNTLAFETSDNSTPRFTVNHNGQASFSGNLDVGSGVDVTGNISVTGLVAGRNLPNDGTKLDGIESGATADQSASEILTLIKTVDGNGSGLDADSVDGISAQDFLRSDTADTASGDITFNGGAGAVTIGGGSDIKFTDTSNWTGEVNGKIQYYGSNYYIQTSGNWNFRASNGNNVVTISQSGDLVADGNVTAYSDARLKTDISTINDALGICGKLRGVSYKWIKNGKPSIGVIAQEVEEIIPEVVLTNVDTNPETGETTEIKSVDYGKIVGVLINAINELKAEVDELKGGK